MKKLDVPVIFVNCAAMKDVRKSLNEPSADKRAARGRIIAYLERNRGRRQYRHAPPANAAVNKLMRPLSKKFGQGISGLRTHWPEIVGDKWAALSKPVNLRGPQGSKSLLVEAKGPAAALLSANAAQLLRKINQYLGQGSVTKLKIIQGRLTAPVKKDQNTVPSKTDVRTDLANPHENSLQSALDALGAQVKKR